MCLRAHIPIGIHSLDLLKTGSNAVSFVSRSEIYGLFEVVARYTYTPRVLSSNRGSSLRSTHDPFKIVHSGKAVSQMTKAFQRKLRLAETHLQNACPTLANWIETQGKCELKPDWERETYEALIRAVAHQQLHSKAAEAILGRLIGRFPDQAFPTSKQLSRLRMESYRTCGFSEAKALAIIGIAKAQERGKIPNRADSAAMTDEMLISALMQLRGIGRWTVEMLLIFTLGRLDIMPVDDFGVRSALLKLYDLSEMPKKAEFTTYTNSWSPYRSVGAWYLWRYADAQK